MEFLNIQRPSEDEGLSLEEKALRANLTNSSSENSLTLTDYSFIPSEDLSEILTLYARVIEEGALYFWLKITPLVTIGIRSLTDKEMDDLKYCSDETERFNLYLFYAVIGINRIIISDSSVLWKLVDFLNETGLGDVIIDYHSQLQVLYNH